MRVRIVRRLGLALLATTFVAGCIQRVYSTGTRNIPLPGQPGAQPNGSFIQSPVKVHMANGNTVIFRGGASVGNGVVVGNGREYGLMDDTSSTIRERVPLDSVVGMETFEGKLLLAQSTVLSAAATALGAVAAAGLAVAIFGSCPTVYADTGAGLALQAEGFSYAIAPLLEHRDVDPLNVRVGADGIIRLELRNEALETHFINHIELLAVRRSAGATVVPDQTGKLVTVGATRGLVAARDRAGRDVTRSLAEWDGELFASALALVDAAHAGDLDDWIDIEANDLPPGDSLAVVLRLRNSLLNTVLLYDGILGGHDAADWLTSGLQNIGTALEVSRWYTRTMGMHLTVDGVPLPVGGAREHARLPDVGPIAFRDVAVVLPRPARDARHVKVRLRFVADEWRIDRAVVAGSVSRPARTPIRVARVVVPNPARGGPAVLDTAALQALGEADGQYLETRPGQRMTLEFAPGRAIAADTSTAYLIAWQGWYREWIRGSWLANPTRTSPWVPGDSAVSIALGRWRDRKDGLERAFYASRIPVR